MTEHHLKTWPDYWDAIERGDKDFEVRRDDRDFQKGDILVLEKWNPSPTASGRYVMGFNDRPQTVRRKIKYILTGGQFGIEPGYVIMGLKK